MSNEVVKWKPVPSKMDEALALVRQRKQGQLQRQNRQSLVKNTVIEVGRAVVNALVPPVCAPERRSVASPRVEVCQVARPLTVDMQPRVVRLLRGCATYRRAFESFYLLNIQRRFQYGASRRLDMEIGMMVYEQLRTTDTTIIPSGDISEETCPWCGYVGFAIYCGNCKSFSCMGETTSVFKCHCGGSGVIEPRRRSYVGMNVR